VHQIAQKWRLLHDMVTQWTLVTLSIREKAEKTAQKETLENSLYDANEAL